MKKNELLPQNQMVHLVKWCFILLFVAAVFCLIWVVLNPYFVYLDMPQGVTFIVVACCIALPWSWQAAVSNQKNQIIAQELTTKQHNPDSKVVAEPSKPKYMALFWCICVLIGLYFLIYGADRLDKINQLNQAQERVTTEMEQDCTEQCALYGIELSDLRGPKIVHVKTYEPHSGKHDYLFSWQSKKPAVQVTGRLYNFDGENWVKPQAIDLKWKGNPLPSVIAEENDTNPEDFAPHYTTMRDDFNTVFEQAEPEINNAFMRAKLSVPKLRGQVTVHVMINSYGQVTAANIDDSEIENAEFENNLIHIVKGLEFKSGEFADLEKNYTFYFK